MGCAPEKFGNHCTKRYRTMKIHWETQMYVAKELRTNVERKLKCYKRETKMITGGLFKKARCNTPLIYTWFIHIQGLFKLARPYQEWFLQPI